MYSSFILLVLIVTKSPHLSNELRKIKILAQQSTKYLIASKYFLLEWIRWISPDGGGSSVHSFSRHCPPAWRKRRSAAFSRKYIAVFLAQEAHLTEAVDEVHWEGFVSRLD